MKTLLITYSNSFPNHKVIQDKNIISFLDSSFPEITDPNKNKERKLKAALCLLDLTEPPKCYCGNDLEFTKQHHSSPKYKSPFGGWREFCSIKCSRTSTSNVEKRASTNLERYGSSSWAKSEVAQDKLGKGEKWSEEKKDSFNEKSRKTNLEKRGVEHHSQTQEYLDKRAETCLEKFGVVNVFQSEEIKAKSKETMLEKYGYYGWFQSEEGRKYATENNPTKNPETLAKIKTTYYSNKSKINGELLTALINENRDDLKRVLEETALKVGDHRKEIANYLGIHHRRLNSYMLRYRLNDMFLSAGKGNSFGEIQVYEFVKSIQPDTIIKERKVIGPKELDIYIPSKKIAIEYNGIYYHSEFNGGKDKYYHVDKTNQCEINGVQLLHIFEHEWENDVQQEIWKSIIRNKLGAVENKVYARDCSVVNLSEMQAEEFFEQNHLNGHRLDSIIKIGLVYGNELMSAMLIGRSKTNKTDELEIFRFSSKINFTVIGAFSKLLKNAGVTNLMSYADRRMCSPLNNVYSNYFKEQTITDPNWYGFSTKDYNPISRWHFSKPKLKKMIPDYDDSKTIFENMTANGYDRIYDSGNLKFSKLKLK